MFTLGKIFAELGSIMVDGALAHCELLLSVSDLKAAQAYVTLYKFELGQNVSEVTKKHLLFER